MLTRPGFDRSVSSCNLDAHGFARRSGAAAAGQPSVAHKHPGPPLYSRQHPKKHRLSSFESAPWPNFGQHQPDPRQQQYQRYATHSSVVIKTEASSGLSYSSPVYSPYAHPMHSDNPPFFSGSSGPSPSDHFSSSLTGYSCAQSDPSFTTIIPSPGETEPSFYLPPTAGQTEPDIPAVYPADSSSFVAGSESCKDQFPATAPFFSGTLGTVPSASDSFSSPLREYSSPQSEPYLTAVISSSGKTEPVQSSYYLTSTAGQTNPDIPAVYPADSSSFVAGSESCKGGGSSQTSAGHCPERELSRYKNKMESKLCDVCEDTAAGFHCGAFVCEACKKFFIRSWKADNSQRYQCTKKEACKITKDTRTHCQRCRYKKCIALQMFPPNMRPTESPDISAIPCRVCGAQSSGFHFGAITCEGCKGFFRRTIHERANHTYRCSKAGNCAINVQTRNNCKSCRFDRCQRVGMSKTGSRIGRQPNAIKHLCGEEIRAQKKNSDQVPSAVCAPPQPSACASAQLHQKNSSMTSQSNQTLTAMMSQPHQTIGVMTSQPHQTIAGIASPPHQTSTAMMSLLQTMNSMASHRQASSVPSAHLTQVQLTSCPAPMAPAQDTAQLHFDGQVPNATPDATRVGIDFPKAITLPSNAWSHAQFRDQLVKAWEKCRLYDKGVNITAMTEDMQMPNVLGIMMERFHVHTNQLLQFAVETPDFRVITPPNQRMLYIEAIYPFTLIQLSIDFNLRTNEYNYFDFKKGEEAIILHHFSKYELICGHLLESGRLIKECNLDRVEISILSYLELIRGGHRQEENDPSLDIFRHLERRAMSALEDYIDHLRPQSALQPAKLQEIHTHLVRMNREHLELVRMLPAVAGHSFSKLFNDMFECSTPEPRATAAQLKEADSTTRGCSPGGAITEVTTTQEEPFS